MAQIIKTTILFRRGLESAWQTNNPILSAGEPGFVTDKFLFKIGDGVTPWNELSYPNQSAGTQGNGIFNAETHYDFPSVGSVNMIYKAQSEKKIYQWNDTELRYELLSEVSLTIDDLDVIHGGNANGST